MTLKEMIRCRCTIREFAARNDIKYDTLLSYVSGKRQLTKASAEMVCKIAAGLHLSPSDLLEEINRTD